MEIPVKSPVKNLASCQGSTDPRRLWSLAKSWGPDILQIFGPDYPAW
jgi:hypothetical protein